MSALSIQPSQSDAAIRFLSAKRLGIFQRYPRPMSAEYTERGGAAHAKAAHPVYRHSCCPVWSPPGQVPQLAREPTVDPCPIDRRDDTVESGMMRSRRGFPIFYPVSERASSTVDPDKNIILVLQMAKVASQAWLKAINQARPDAAVHHMHRINPVTIERVRAMRAVTGPRQTMAFFSVPDGTAAASVREAVGLAVDNADPVKIVSGIRDPVDRAISLLFYLAEVAPHTYHKLAYWQGVSAIHLVDFFRQAWIWALDDLFSGGTFEHFLSGGFVLYRSWFDTEIADVFGIDLENASYDSKRRALIHHQGPVGLLVYRFEDLRADGPDLPILMASTSDFVGAPIRDLPQVNRTDMRPAAKLYTEFRRIVTLPDEILKVIYAAPILQKFYTAEELARMKQRWAAR